VPPTEEATRPRPILPRKDLRGVRSASHLVHSVTLSSLDLSVSVIRFDISPRFCWAHGTFLREQLSVHPLVIVISQLDPRLLNGISIPGEVGKPFKLVECVHGAGSQHYALTVDGHCKGTISAVEHGEVAGRDSVGEAMFLEILKASFSVGINRDCEDEIAFDQLQARCTGEHRFTQAAARAYEQDDPNVPLTQNAGSPPAQRTHAWNSHDLTQSRPLFHPAGADGPHPKS
jgi:hypothetical protein